MFLETSKVRDRVLRYFPGKNGIDVGCQRDPLKGGIVTVDLTPWPEVTNVCDASKLPFPDGHFDWLWSSHCLEDFEDTVSILTEWLRVIKPNGTIGIYVPHPDLYKGHNAAHKVAGFKPDELAFLLEAQDCKILEAFVDDLPIEVHPHHSTLVIARKL